MQADRTGPCVARAWGSTPSGRHRVHRGSASCRLSLVPRALAARASSALPENAGPIRCRYRACVAKRQEQPCGGHVLCARLHVSSAGRRRARREARRTGACASMATCVCHHGATARQGGAAGAEEAPHSRVWAHPARRPVACRGGAPACVAAHSPRRRRHTRWPASGAAASAAEASAPAVSCGTARAVGQREEQEDTLLVLPRLFGGYTYAGEPPVLRLCGG